MSGLEIGALVAGAIGAAAGTVSAGNSFKEHKEIKRAGQTITVDRWAMSAGNGKAYVDKKGTLHASSSSGGYAAAGYTKVKK